MKTKLPVIHVLTIFLVTISNSSFAQCFDDARVSAVFEKPVVTEQRVIDAQYSEYRTKYDQLWNQGYRLQDLDVPYSYGIPRYSAVWRPNTAGEYQIYDVILHGVTEKKSFNSGEGANSDDYTSTGYSLENSVKVYPTHSSTGQFTLQIDNVSDASLCQLEVYNLMGVKQEVYLKDIKLGSGIQEFDLNLNGYDNGAYFVKFKIGEAIVTKRIFIIE